MSDTPRTEITSKINLDLCCTAIAAANDGTIHNAWCELLADARHIQAERDELLLERSDLKAENVRLSSQHSPNCDVFELSPMLGPSEKPCNCRARLIAELQREKESLTQQLAVTRHYEKLYLTELRECRERIEALEQALADIRLRAANGVTDLRVYILLVEAAIPQAVETETKEKIEP